MRSGPNAETCSGLVTNALARSEITGSNAAGEYFSTVNDVRVLRRLRDRYALTDGILDHRGEFADLLSTVAAKTGAMHQGEGARVQIRQPSQRGVGVGRIGHVLGHGAGQILQYRFTSAIEHARIVQRLGISGMKKQIRAEQRAVDRFEKQTGVPAVRDMRRGEELHATRPGIEY